MMKILLIATIILFGPTLWASPVFIYVSDSPNSHCPPKIGKEETQYRLMSDEAIMAVKNYLKNVSNPLRYDEAFKNAGLKFCGKEEEKRIFSEIIQFLDQKKPPEKTYAFFKDYCSNNHFLYLLEHRMQSSVSQSYQNHLSKAFDIMLSARKNRL